MKNEKTTFPPVDPTQPSQDDPIFAAIDTHVTRYLGPATVWSASFCFYVDFRPFSFRIFVSVCVCAFKWRLLAPCLRIQKFRSRRLDLSAKFDRTALVNWSFALPQFGICGSVLQLFRIESERLKLPAPFSRRIAEPLYADAAGQATFYGCFDKIGREEGERDGHIDLSNAALLAVAKLCDRGYSTRDHIIEPPTTSGDGADQAGAAFELFRTDFASRCIVREQDLAGSFGWRFLPGNCERQVFREIGCVVRVI
jgi:hypothetical protein